MATRGIAQLKAQYNRVRTSTALQGNSMWNNVIGIENEQKGTNSAIEATLRAPSYGGGYKAQRMERAQQLIEASGYQPKATDLQGLLALAKSQGATGNATRGACKICGGLGHLTKKCKNGVSGHTGDIGDLDAAAAAASIRALLPDPDEVSSLDSSDLDGGSSDSELGGSGDSDSDSGRKRKRSGSKKLKKDSKRKKSKRSKKEGKKKDKDKKAAGNGKDRGAQRKQKEERRRTENHSDGSSSDSGSSGDERERKRRRQWSRGTAAAVEGDGEDKRGMERKHHRVWNVEAAEEERDAGRGRWELQGAEDGVRNHHHDQLDRREQDGQGRERAGKPQRKWDEERPDQGREEDERWRSRGERGGERDYDGERWRERQRDGDREALNHVRDGRSGKEERGGREREQRRLYERERDRSWKREQERELECDRERDGRQER